VNGGQDAEPASPPHAHPAAHAAEPSHARRGSRSRPEPRTHGPFVPLLIFFVAALAWSAFQFYQLRLERGSLAALHANQENLVQQSQKVRAALDALASQTQRLADRGNPNAKLVVDELRKRGITINTSAAASAAAR
jgi:hypothetical protein